MTINAEQLIFILENTPPQQNIMLVGRHGIGKSQILEEFFQKKGFKVTTLFLGQMSDPGDLIGLPKIFKERQTFSAMDKILREKTALLRFKNNHVQPQGLRCHKKGI